MKRDSSSDAAMFLFYPAMYMSRRRRQTFVLGLLFFLFGDLISAEIETPDWPAATGEMNSTPHPDSSHIPQHLLYVALAIFQARSVDIKADLTITQIEARLHNS